MMGAAMLRWLATLAFASAVACQREAPRPAPAPAATPSPGGWVAAGADSPLEAEVPPGFERIGIEPGYTRGSVTVLISPYPEDPGYDDELATWKKSFAGKLIHKHKTPDGYVLSAEGKSLGEDGGSYGNHVFLVRRTIKGQPYMCHGFARARAELDVALAICASLRLDTP